MKRLLFFIFSIAILFAACSKSEVSQYDPNVKGELSIEFDHIAGEADLQLNTGLYTNAAGESFKLTKLKYYVSNFILTQINGDIFIVPRDSCYFLIDESDPSTQEPVLRVPEGEYKTLTFTIGVDSLNNTEHIGLHTGVLDPNAAGGDMYWSLSKNYIFFNMEGISSASVFMYHIGNSSATSSTPIHNLKTITLDLAARGVPQVKAGKETNVHLMVDILKMFNASPNISIAAHPLVMSDAYSINIANNYATMFRHDHSEN